MSVVDDSFHQPMKVEEHAVHHAAYVSAGGCAKIIEALAAC